MLKKDLPLKIGIALFVFLTVIFITDHGSIQFELDRQNEGKDRILNLSIETQPRTGAPAAQIPSTFAPLTTKGPTSSSILITPPTITSSPLPIREQEGTRFPSTSTPTITRTPTSTPTPTNSLTPTPSSTSSRTPSPTSSSTPTPTPSPTPTPTPTTIPIEATTRYGTTTIFEHASGNTRNPATARAYVPKGINIYTVRLTGQGHNQDRENIGRTMEVKVNGNKFRVIDGIPRGGARSFNYILPAGILVNGWNDIEAYIHWGDEESDNGHWINLNLVLETKTVNITGYGTTTIFSNERGNTEDKAYAQVIISPSMVIQDGNISISGWGMNRDAGVYSRTMRVKINGTIVVTLDSIPDNQTHYFSIPLNPALFHTGDNEVYAYIHKGDEEQDDGHRLELKVTINIPEPPGDEDPPPEIPD